MTGLLGVGPQRVGERMQHRCSHMWSEHAFHVRTMRRYSSLGMFFSTSAAIAWGNTGLSSEAPVQARGMLRVQRGLLHVQCDMCAVHEMCAVCAGVQGVQCVHLSQRQLNLKNTMPPNGVREAVCVLEWR